MWNFQGTNRFLRGGFDPQIIFINPEPTNKDMIVTAKNADITNFEILFLESLGFFFLTNKIYRQHEQRKKNCPSNNSNWK